MIKQTSSSNNVPENFSLPVPKFVSLLTGLFVIVAAIYFLHLEEKLKLLQLFIIVVAGFIINAFSPVKFRLYGLFITNLIAIFILLGVAAGLILFLFAIALFVILILPFSVRVRTFLLIGAGIFFALVRLKFITFANSEIVVPVLAGLFMFRSILFLHEQRFIKKDSSWLLKLNYFFLLPNLIFVIFPVVDYKTYVNNYYSKPAFETYRKGVLWITNGIFHLFIYRIIYYYLVPNPTDIQNVYDWLQFVIASYALIVRLAGIFHFSAGVLCLFGFDLPRTFHNYFFADSFNDVWRRINIYWRDFVMKVFYYPVYFKVKHLGIISGIVISILITFVFNWLLHSYQWFWIRGTILFTIQDISFWMVFGIVVMINSVYQAKRGSKGKTVAGFRFISACLLALRITGVFLFIAILWSWWTTPSIEGWFGLLSVWATISLNDVVILLLSLAGVILSGVFVQYIMYVNDESGEKQFFPYSYNYYFSIIGIGLLAALGLPSITTKVENTFSIDMQPVLHTQLNAADREMQFKGYYETILSGNNLLSTPIDQLENEKQNDWQQLQSFDAFIFTNDLITKKLKPNLDLMVKGVRFRTNIFGLHDRDIQLEKPESTLRMALLGGSIEMGSGINTEQTYENIVEDELTKEKLFAPYKKVEIVNFAIQRTHLPQHLARIDKVVPDFHPEVIIYTAHSDELARTMDALYRIYSSNPNTGYEYIDKLFLDLNLPKDADEFTFKRAIRPKMMEFISWGLEHIKNKAISINALPIWMFVPAMDGKNNSPELDKSLFEIAKKSGFYILDLSNFNDTIPEDDLTLRSWDRHPNVQGHSLLAKKMIFEFHRNNELVKAIIQSYHSN